MLSMIEFMLSMIEFMLSMVEFVSSMVDFMLRIVAKEGNVLKISFIDCISSCMTVIKRLRRDINQSIDQ